MTDPDEARRLHSGSYVERYVRKPYNLKDLRQALVSLGF